MMSLRHSHLPNWKENATAVVRQGTSPQTVDKRRRFLMINGQLNKAQSHPQAKNAHQSITATTTTNRSTQSVEKKDTHIEWAGIHCSFSQVVALKDLILLDRDSRDTIFCNPKMLKISGKPNQHWSWGHIEDH